MIALKESGEILAVARDREELANLLMDNFDTFNITADTIERRISWFCDDVSVVLVDESTHVTVPPAVTYITTLKREDMYVVILYHTGLHIAHFRQGCGYGQRYNVIVDNYVELVDYLKSIGYVNTSINNITNYMMYNFYGNPIEERMYHWVKYWKRLREGDISMMCDGNGDLEEYYIDYFKPQDLTLIQQAEKHISTIWT